MVTEQTNGKQEDPMLQEVRRTTQREKKLMQEIIDGENELALTDDVDDQYITGYRLEHHSGRYSQGQFYPGQWQIIAFVRTVHPECKDWYTAGQDVGRGWFSRCTLCGDIDHRWDDECPECLNCYDTGKVHELDPTALFYAQMAAARYQQK
jgi:hypothetical protein